MDTNKYLISLFLLLITACTFNKNENEVVRDNSTKEWKKQFQNSFWNECPNLGNYYIGSWISFDEPDTLIRQKLSAFLLAFEEEPYKNIRLKKRDTIYRFLCLPAFDKPVVISIKKRNNKIVFEGKISNSPCGAWTGKIETVIRKELSKEVWKTLSLKLKQANFWNLPSRIDDRSGFDGSDWFLEGITATKHHYVHRWAPESKKDSLSKKISNIGYFLLKELEVNLDYTNSIKN